VPPVAAIPIEDPADARVADYVGLRQRGDRPGGVVPTTVVVEGHLVIQRLLQSDLRVRSVLVSPRGLRLLADDLAAADVPTYLASPEVLRAIVGFDLHRGAVAVAERPAPLAVGEALAGTRLAAVLEGVNDHENLGAVARSAVALGVEALVLSPDCADPLYRRSVRVSMGHVLRLPTARLAPWPEGLGALRDAGWAVVALTPDPAAPLLEELALADGQRVAVLLGAEGPGLTPAALAAADHRVRIAMAPGVDSLNVAHAAAIAFHHLAHLGRRPAR
jgi:tRNA G18 (ribose-2'-O)-methylase SpoU